MRKLLLQGTRYRSVFLLFVDGDGMNVHFHGCSNVGPSNNTARIDYDNHICRYSGGGLGAVCLYRIVQEKLLTSC